MSRKKFTEEIKQWVLNNYKDYKDYKELTEIVNKKFSTNFTQKSFRSLCSLYLKIKLNSRYGEGYPIGTISIAKGLKYIKIDNKPYTGGTGTKPNWVPYREYLYIQQHGPIKDNEIIISLDNSYDNLIAVPKDILIILKIKHLYNKGILTEAAIEILKTEKLIKEMEGE